MLSGLSRGGGRMLPRDPTEDCLDRLGLSIDPVVDPRDREDDVDEDSVLDRELFPKMELLFICSV
jgi:hypothetical protein